MARLSIPVLFFIALVAVSCSVNPNASEDKLVLAQATPAQQEPCKPSTKHVQFENVSFDYDPCAFGELKPSKVPDHRLERATDKPDGVAPEHLRFEFDKGPEGWEPFVEIYPVQRFPEMYAVNKRFMKDMQRQIRDLQKAIEEPSYRVNTQIPYLPYVDAGQDLQAHVKTYSFAGGRGIYFLTYISIEFTLVCNDHLRYIFEGLTSDGKYYVLAELPVAASFLTDDGAGLDHYSFEGFTHADLWEMVETNPYSPNSNSTRNAEMSKRYHAYLTAVIRRLEETNLAGFNPSLSKLEELVASLQMTN
jgi:hypothetical protein